MAVVDELLIKIGADLQPMEESFEAAGKKTRSLVNRIEKYGKKLDRMRIVPTFTMNDRISRRLQKLEGKLRYMSRRTYDITLRVKDRVSRKINNIKGKLSGLGVFSGIGAIGAGFLGYDTMQTFADWEQKMVDTKAVTQATADEFDKLKKVSRDLGGSTRYTSKQIGEAMEFLGMAGYEVKEITNAMPGIVDMAAATSTNLANSADILSNILTGFKLEAQETKRVADIMTKTVTSANLTIQNLGETMKYVAPVAQSVSLSVEEVAAATASLAEVGIRGSKAGTTLRTALTKLADPSKEALTTMTRLGVEITDNEGKFKGFADIIQDFKEKTDDMTESQRLAAASQIFGREAASGMVELISNGGKTLDEFTDKLKKAGGTSRQVADEKLDTFAGSMMLLNSAINSVQLTIGDKFAPTIREMADWLREQMPSIEKFADRIMPKVSSSVKNAFNEFQDFIEALQRSEDFQKLDWSGKIVYVLNRMTDSMSDWLAGEGGDKVERIFTSLAEIAGKAWLGTLKSFFTGSLKNLKEGDLSGAGGLGLLTYLLGGGALVKGAGGILKLLGKGGNKAKTVLGGASRAGGTGTGGRLLSQGSKGLSMAPFGMLTAGVGAKLAGSQVGQGIFGDIPTPIESAKRLLTWDYGNKGVSPAKNLRGTGDTLGTSPARMLGADSSINIPAVNQKVDNSVQIGNINPHIEIHEAQDLNEDDLAWRITHRITDEVLKHVENSS